MADALAVKIMRIGEHDLPLPQYQTADAAGMDIHAGVVSAFSLLPGQRALIPTGFAIAVPPGYEAQIRPRSGLAAQHGVTVLNSPGTIDADYRGEVKILLVNLSNEPFVIERGMRIAQMIIGPVSRVQWEAVFELPGTGRSGGGFGHTGA